MNNTEIKEIVIIGAGNLATQLSMHLQKSGLIIKQVYSRTTESARELASILNVEYITDIVNIAAADLYIFAVADKAIESLSKKITNNNAIFVHTAGSVDMDVFADSKTNYGVFYPLQTFSKYRDVNFQNIPICIEGSNIEVENKLLLLAKRISSRNESISSIQRKQLHLAAVFVCNFTNHMYSIGEKILNKENMQFDLLKSLISETADKINIMTPKEAQTGPAIRFDENTINKHQEMLNDNVCLQKIYKFVSESIFSEHKK